MPRILFVEDHEDTRDLICELLRTSGYQVEGVGSAEEGLEALKAGGFEVLLTDHWLQGGRTGSWLVNEAYRLGILPGTIVCSAERVLPQLPPGVATVRKPVDVDHLLSEIARVTKPSPAVRPRVEIRVVPDPPESGESLHANARGLDLVLYVTRSQCSQRGIRNLQRFLARYPTKQLTLSVIDISSEPLGDGTSGDRIAFTPMLVKRGPGPRERLVGDFQDTEALADLFLRSGLEPLEGVA